jgi:two-component system LytT family response regulator
MKVKTVIIDDDFYAIENTKLIISQLDVEIEIVGEANSVVAGIKAINKNKPELIILDIELPDGNAFDLLDCYEDYDFNIIFVSAFNHYAVKAFKYSSIAFLEKPITKDEFKIAFDKVKTEKLEKSSYKNLAENYKSQKPFKIELKTREGIYYVDVNDIMYIEADGRYSTIYINNSQKVVISKGIGEFDELLAEWNFYRTHLSFLVNINYVLKILPADDGQILMKNNSKVTLSGKKRDHFIEKMKDILCNE